MPQHFCQHGFIDGRAGCRAIEARFLASSHNVVCRSRIKRFLSKTSEEKDTVERGYAIIASVAQRISE